MASRPQETFNDQLLQLSDALVRDELDKMKFLCKDLGIGNRILEKINTGCELFVVLMQRKKLSADDTKFLETLLTKVGREELVDILNTWTAASGQSELSEAEGGKIVLATEVIAANLGRTWRKLARKLCLNEVKIQSIAQSHLDLEETATKVIWEWRKAQGSQASVEKLVDALRECDQNLTADRVEDKIRLAKEKSSPIYSETK